VCVCVCVCVCVWILTLIANIFLKVLIAQCCQGTFERNFPGLPQEARYQTDPIVERNTQYSYYSQVEMPNNMFIINSCQYGGISVQNYFAPALIQQLKVCEGIGLDEVFRRTRRSMDERVIRERYLMETDIHLADEQNKTARRCISVSWFSIKSFCFTWLTSLS